MYNVPFANDCVYNPLVYGEPQDSSIGKWIYMEVLNHNIIVIIIKINDCTHK